MTMKAGRRSAGALAVLGLLCGGLAACDSDGDLDTAAAVTTPPATTSASPTTTPTPKATPTPTRKPRPTEEPSVVKNKYIKATVRRFGDNPVVQSSLIY